MAGYVGEWKTQVPVRFDGATVERIDREVARFPFCEGRSAMARSLVLLALDAIDAGIIEFEPGTLQQVQSNLQHQKEQRVQQRQGLQSVQRAKK